MPSKKTKFVIGLSQVTPPWIIAIGLHIAFLLALTFISLEHFSNPRNATFNVSLEATPQRLAPLDGLIRDAQLYQPDTIPKDSFFQPTKFSAAHYPGFLPDPKEMAPKKADNENSVKKTSNLDDPLTYLPNGGASDSRKSGLVFGKARGGTAMGVGGGGPGGEVGSLASDSGADGSGGAGGTIPTAMQGGNTMPVYPEIARQLGQEGRVLLLVTVGENGLVQEIKILESSGYRILDESALNAVKKWIFIPAAKNSKPVTGTIEIPIRFKLN